MRAFLAVVVIAAVAIAAVGCGAKMTNPYIMTTDRVDQKLEVGNRGYVKGTPPPVGDRGDLKRPWIAVDVDLPESSGTTSVAAVEKVEEKPVEIKREVTVVKEETPTTVKNTTIVVTEEEIK